MESRVVAEGKSGCPNAPAGGEAPLVIVVGEHLDTGLHVVEAFLADLAGVSSKILVVLARRAKPMRPPADVGESMEYQYLVSSAKRQGIELKVNLLTSRDPVQAVLRECEAYATADPDALFCFIEWGLGDEGGGLARTLAARKLKTTNLFELVGRKTGGVEK